MKNEFVKSILTKCTEDVFQARDFKVAKYNMRGIIENSNIKTKKQMLLDLDKLNNLVAIQRYCANALLKFEGLGVS